MHQLLTDEPGRKMLLLGNEAIARGALEAGVAVAATYPGTPSSEISLNLFQVSHESDLYFEYSTNEKVALEITAASANCGVRSMCIMKHVGLNVAADALMTLAYVGVKGALVILVADDPFMFSSQNEQDSRYYARIAGLPLLEPSTVDEAREMTAFAFELSETLKVPVLLRTTTRINHSTGIVTLGALRKPQTKGDFIKDPFNYVTIPAVSRKLHVRLLDSLDKAAMLAGESKYNMADGNGRWGIISNGVSHTYISDAVHALNIADKVKTLRIGFSHPMPAGMIADFLSECDKVLIVEEGEPVMEESIKAIAQENRLTMPIRGKGEGLFSRLYEFNPAMVREVVANYFGASCPARTPVDTSDLPPLPPRPPTLCAGCSHRATFYAVRKAAEGLDVMYPTDIGCYTLGVMPPHSMADFLICMGSSTGTSGGFSLSTDKKVVSFIGDSTFFHSGMTGLVNAVFNNHDFTLVILDNGTTAMTGHQPNPGVDMERLGFEGYGRVDIEAVVRSFGVKHISIIEPYKIKKSIDTIREALAVKGVSVIIAREFCSLYTKTLKLPRRKPFHVSSKCRNHRICVDQLGCPAFLVKDGRVTIDADRCTGCAVCAQICPENAILPVKN